MASATGPADCKEDLVCLWTRSDRIPQEPVADVNAGYYILDETTTHEDDRRLTHPQQAHDTLQLLIKRCPISSMYIFVNEQLLAH